MSSIASFHLLNKEKVEKLKEVAIVKKNWRGKVIDTFYDFLNQQTTELEKYNYPGFVLATLLSYFKVVPFVQTNIWEN